MAHVDDDDWDDLLDGVLDEFAAPVPMQQQPSAAITDPPKQSDMSCAASATNLDSTEAMDQEFMAQLAKNMEMLLQPASNSSATSHTQQNAIADLLKDSNGDADTIKNLEELRTAFAGLSKTTEKEGVEPIREPKQFQDHVAQTMNKLRESSDKAKAQANEDMRGGSSLDDPLMADMLKELEGMMDSEGFEDMFGGFVDQLMKKEFLYEPLKTLSEKYPPWLEANRSSLTEHDRVRYESQLEAIYEIKSIYEKLPSDEPTSEQSKEIMDCLAKIQGFGNPPDELMKQMMGGEGVGSDGMPDIPGENCNQM